jgi:hypothetical protein
MPYTLVRRRSDDYERWRAVFDDGEAARREAGIIKEIVFLNVDDPNDALVLQEVEDVERAREFDASPRSRERRRNAGIVEDALYLEAD